MEFNGLVGMVAVLCLIAAALGAGSLMQPEMTKVETDVLAGGEYHTHCDSGEYAVAMEVEGQSLLDGQCFDERSGAVEASNEHEKELMEIVNPTRREQLWAGGLPLIGFIGGVAYVGWLNRGRKVAFSPIGTLGRGTLTRVATTALLMYVVIILGAGLAAALTNGPSNYEGFFNQFESWAILTTIHGWLPALFVALVVEAERRVRMGVDGDV